MLQLRFPLPIAAAALLSLAAAPAPAAGLLGEVKVWPKPDGFKGACPKELKFHAGIQLRSPPGTLNYHWERNDGAQGPEAVVEVKKGQKAITVSDDWTVSKSGKYRETLVVNSGNQHLRKTTHVVIVTCK